MPKPYHSHNQNATPDLARIIVDIATILTPGILQRTDTGAATRDQIAT